VFWVISLYFNIRNTLPKSGTFLLGHPVYFWLHLAPFFLEREIFHKDPWTKSKHILYSVNFFRKSCRWHTWHTSIACWISKATNTLSENAITFVFPLQHWLHEHVEMFIYTNIACCVILHCTSFCVWSLCNTRTILNILCFVFSCLYLLLHHRNVLNDLYLGVFAEMRKVTTSFSHVSPSVHQSVPQSSCYNLVPIGQIFMKFRICIFFKIHQWNGSSIKIWQ